MKRIKNMIRTITTNNIGFTMIELIIAIAVLSILAGLAIAVLDPFTQVQKANDARRKSDLSELQKVLEQYYQDNGQYPPSDLNGSQTLEIVYQNAPIAWGTGPFGPYINVLPKDPVASRYYIYYSSAPYQSYYLYASLERGGADAQACQVSVDNCRKGPLSIYCICSNTPSCGNTAGCNSTTKSGGGVVAECGADGDHCNFGVTSPNVSP